MARNHLKSGDVILTEMVSAKYRDGPSVRLGVYQFWLFLQHICGSLPVPQTALLTFLRNIFQHLPHWHVVCGPTSPMAKRANSLPACWRGRLLWRTAINVG